MSPVKLVSIIPKPLPIARRFVLAAALGLLLAGKAYPQEDFGDRRVEGLRFVGNEAIDSYTLSRSISTSKSSHLFSVGFLPRLVTRVFDETEFRRDVVRLTLLYRQSGYMDVVIDTVVRRTDDDVKITFRIFEGEPVRVSSIRVRGAEDLFPEDILTRDMPLRPGDPFNRFLFQAATDTLISFFQNRGYALVDVYRGFDVDRGARTADLTFDVYPGPPSTVGDISVMGNRAISEGLIRRSIALQEGELFRREDIFDSQRSLYRLNVFNFVDVGVDSTDILRGDSVVDVNVRVQEGRMTTLRGGVGFGTVDCMRAIAGFSFDNLLGDARAVDLTARISKVGATQLSNSLCSQLGRDTVEERSRLNHNIALSFRIPSLFTRNSRAVFTFSHERTSEFLAYFRDAVGFTFTYNRALSRNLSGTVSYDVSYGRTVADDATFCSFLNVCRQEDISPFKERLTRSTLGLSATLDRTNSSIQPTRGWRAYGEFRWASPTIGSDDLARFTRLLGELTAYRTIFRNGVLAFRIRSGTILSNSFSTAGQEIRFIPIEERYYAGGPSSVRGFGQNELGPTVRVIRMNPDPTSPDSIITTKSATGGNSILVANLELRFPLPGFARRLSAAIFVDAGRVVERGARLFSGTPIRFTPGAGIRFATPIGPLRLDIGYNPYDPESGLVFREDGTQLILVPNAPAEDPPQTFVDRLKINIAIGQAF